MQSELESNRLDRMASDLAESTRSWIESQTLWKAFASAFPGLAQRPDQRRLFLAALQEIERRGVIRLPKAHGSRWDRTFDIAVPTSVYLLSGRGDGRESAWKSFPWHSLLQWVAVLPFLNREQEEFLKRVHHGLVKGEFRKRAPLKYRSLQLTGKEKRLGEFTKMGLFGPGKLNLNILGCYAEVPPLACEAVGDSPLVIVFENADSFAVARDFFRSLKSPPYGMVAFGGGNGIARSLPYLKMIGRPVQEVHYVGDLDYHGLKIAQRAIRTGVHEGISIQPATALHRAMLAASSAFGRADGWPIGKQSPPKPATVEKVIPFLDASLREKVSSILVSGNRIPEEVLGPEELTALWT